MERVAEMRTAMAGLGDEFKVSFNDIVLKAVATALAQHPRSTPTGWATRFATSTACTSAWQSPSRTASLRQSSSTPIASDE
jgi:hypothetical protein